MRLTLLPVLVLVALPLCGAADPSQAPSSAASTSLCKISPTVASATPKSGRMQTLGELPPAAQIQTVWRQVDNCPTPVVLRDGIGANEKQKDAVSGDGILLPAQ